MTIATKNGVPIIKDGSVAQNCGCCGGWSCFGPTDKTGCCDNYASYRVTVACPVGQYTWDTATGIEKGCPQLGPTCPLQYLDDGDSWVRLGQLNEAYEVPLQWCCSTAGGCAAFPDTYQIRYGGTLYGGHPILHPYAEAFTHAHVADPTPQQCSCVTYFAGTSFYRIGQGPQDFTTSAQVLRYVNGTLTDRWTWASVPTTSVTVEFTP
jgi:hypothetical protein